VEPLHLKRKKKKIKLTGTGYEISRRQKLSCRRKKKVGFPRVPDPDVFSLPDSDPLLSGTYPDPSIIKKH
jgi:hypothetical protein